MIDLWFSNAPLSCFIFQEFHDELKAEEINVQSAIKKGQVILRFCHPSATQIIQQWLARLNKRWDEVWKWSSQRLNRLEEEKKKLGEEKSLMDELLKWIEEKSDELNEKEKEPIPDEDYDEIQLLLDEHKVGFGNSVVHPNRKTVHSLGTLYWGKIKGVVDVVHLPLTSGASGSILELGKSFK